MRWWIGGFCYLSTLFYTSKTNILTFKVLKSHPALSICVWITGSRLACKSLWTWWVFKQNTTHFILNVWWRHLSLSWAQSLVWPIKTLLLCPRTDSTALNPIQHLGVGGSQASLPNISDEWHRFRHGQALKPAQWRATGPERSWSGVACPTTRCWNTFLEDRPESHAGKAHTHMHTNGRLAIGVWVCVGVCVCVSERVLHVCTRSVYSAYWMHEDSRVFAPIVGANVTSNVCYAL